MSVFSWCIFNPKEGACARAGAGARAVFPGVQAAIDEFNALDIVQAWRSQPAERQGRGGGGRGDRRIDRLRPGPQRARTGPGSIYPPFESVL